MKYLVTGGAGFIGGHLVNKLLESGTNSVIVLDRWSSKAVGEAVESGSVEFVQGDVRDTDLLVDQCKRVDVVYHLASILGTSESIEVYDPEEVAEVNVIGTLKVLKASRKSSVGRMVYLSTPDVPWLNSYKITKTAAERFCMMFHKEYGLETVVLKLPNVYGPRERWAECDWGAPYNYQKVIPTFIMRALRNEPLPIFGQGSQRAIYAHVEDVARALSYAGNRNGCEGQVIPIGAGKPTSVYEIAKMVLDLTGSKSEMEFLPMRAGEIELDIDVDMRTAEERLGFLPEISLHDGLRLTIPFYASVLDSEDKQAARQSGR